MTDALERPHLPIDTGRSAPPVTANAMLRKREACLSAGMHDRVTRPLRVSAQLQARPAPDGHRETGAP